MPIGAVYEALYCGIHERDGISLDDVGPGQWVRERILTAYPRFVIDRGADLDGNGRIDTYEHIEDADGDGCVNSIHDFIAYYAHNRASLEKAIPYFRWAAALDPNNIDPFNPIHDHLNLSARMLPPELIRDAYTWLRGFIAGARLLVHPAMSEGEWTRVLIHELKHYTHISNDGPIMPEGLFSSAIRRDDAAIIVAGTALELGFGKQSHIDDPFAETEDAAAMRDRSLLARSYARHGHSCAIVGMIDEAVAQYTQAIELDPDSPVHRLNLGEILLRQDRPTDALAVYDDALGFSQDSSAYVGIGRAQLAMGRNEEALDAFADAIEADSRNATAYFNRGRLLHTSGKMRAALRDYTRAFKLDRSFALAYYYAGVILRDRGRLNDALWCLNKAIRSDLRGASAFFFDERGTIHHALKRLDDAERDFDEAIRRGPMLSQAWTNRGYLRQERRRYLEALADYDRAVAIDPSNVEALCGRGHLLLDLKQTDRAFLDLEAAVRINARYPDAHFGLGLIYAQRGKDIEALKAFTAAIDVNPQRAPAHYLHQRGMVWKKLEKWNEAYADYSKAIDRDQNLADAYNRRSEIRKKLKDYLGAQSDLAAACRLDPAICSQK